MSKNQRILTVISEMRKRAKRYAEQGLRIVSANSFPTAAGLASSAAGYAALTVALADVFQVPMSSDLTRVARMGSGSACRSLYEGLVAWESGTQADGCDSIAVAMAPKTSWLDISILVLNAAKKNTSSTEGMVRSVQTSELLRYRAKHIVPARVRSMVAAYRDKDFETFGRIMMQDSNQFHATCLDTYPPVFYLTDDSRKVINFVHGLNRRAGKIVAAYTFDAGPNAVIFTQHKDTAAVLSAIEAKFPIVNSNADGATDDAISTKDGSAIGVVKNIYRTRVGDGPRKLPRIFLADCKSGLPLPKYTELI